MFVSPKRPALTMERCFYPPGGRADSITRVRVQSWAYRDILGRQHPRY